MVPKTLFPAPHLLVAAGFAFCAAAWAQATTGFTVNQSQEALGDAQQCGSQQHIDNAGTQRNFLITGGVDRAIVASEKQCARALRVAKTP